MFTLTKEEMIDLIEKALVNILPEVLININKAGEPVDKPMTIEETAEFLSVSKPTLHNWRKQGIISCSTKGGRVYFSRKDVLSFLNKTKGKK